MNNSALISVIVPVYNVQKYLERCLDSILRQTYQKLEIILVDNGSTDASGRICDSYAARDERIKVIHTDNLGVSHARNTGVEAARGELLGFVDSDDCIAPDMYETLLRNLIKEDADISVCGIYQCFGENPGVAESDFNSELEVVTPYEAISVALENSCSYYLWNKLYKRELFSKIRFPVGKIYEDAFIMVRLLDCAKRIVYAKWPGYFYIRRADSLTLSGYDRKELDLVEACAFNLSYVKEKHPELADRANYRLLRAYFYVLDKMPADKLSKEDVKDRNRVVRILRKNLFNILKYPWFRKSRKLAAIVLMINLKLYKACTKLA